MDTETYEKSRQPTPLPAKDLADIAKRLSYIASRYAEIAQRIAEIPGSTIDATGRPTAERGEKFLLTWLKTLQAALDRHYMGDFDAAEKRAEGRKKKGKS